VASDSQSMPPSLRQLAFRSRTPATHGRNAHADPAGPDLSELQRSDSSELPLSIRTLSNHLQSRSSSPRTKGLQSSVINNDDAEDEDNSRSLSSLRSLAGGTSDALSHVKARLRSLSPVKRRGPSDADTQ